jgi:cytochrome d ubiquinol oxidase subunit II
LKTVDRVPTGWLANYSKYRWTIAAPVAAFGAGLLALALVRRLPTTALILSCASVAGVVLTAGFALFPFIMPSSSQPASSLTAWDAVSSYRTLQVMFWAVVIFLPIIILYTSWVYRVMRGKITTEHVRRIPTRCTDGPSSKGRAQCGTSPGYWASARRSRSASST